MTLSRTIHSLKIDLIHTTVMLVVQFLTKLVEVRLKLEMEEQVEAIPKMEDRCSHAWPATLMESLIFIRLNTPWRHVKSGIVSA